MRERKTWPEFRDIVTVVALLITALVLIVLGSPWYLWGSLAILAAAIVVEPLAVGLIAVVQAATGTEP